jgi:streptogramin lyase
MNMSSGSVTSFVGALGNLSTINGQGSSVRFNAPTQVAKDSQGNLFIAEGFSHCIRKISPAGVVSTFAGLAGTSGTSDGNGAAARFNTPFGIVIDSSDNLYVADGFNHAIRKIAPNGDVTTFAGSPGNPGYTDDTGTNARFTLVWALTIDASGNLFVADAGNSLIRKITAAGVVTTIAGTPGIPGHVDGPALTANLDLINGISINSSGDLFVTEYFDNGGGNLYYVRKITPGGDVTTITNGTTLNDPRGIVVDSDGYLYVADVGNSLIRKISPTGSISTLLGSQGVFSSIDGNKSTARLAAPFGMSLYGNDIYFTEASGTVLKFNYK